MIPTLFRDDGKPNRFSREPGLRLQCKPCETAWTGPRHVPCWACGEEGELGGLPSVYPDVDQIRGA